MIKFGNNSYIYNTYSATGEKLTTQYAIQMLPVLGPLSENGGTTGTEGVSGPGGTRSGPATPVDTDHKYYCGNVVYDRGVTRLLTDEGYVTFSETGTPIYHYYLRDHLGNIRVVMGQTGTVEQVNHYYAFGGLIRESTNPGLQPYKYGGKEIDRFSGLDAYDFGARSYFADRMQWSTMDPLCEKYYDVSPYGYCMNNPVNALDPDGEKIVFINGKIGGGSPPAGQSYWGGSKSPFVTNAKKVLNDNNIFFSYEDYDYTSSAWQREKKGFEWAESNYSQLIENMSESETFKLVSHSMGSAFAKGVERYLKIQGKSVEYNIMLNAYQIDDINNEDDTDTFYVDYINTTDPVLFLFDPNMGKGELENSDIIIRQPIIDSGFLHIHRYPIDNGISW